MIKKTSVDQVIDTARIEEVVGDFVRLKKRGSGYQGLCPFHQEKTPSFSVNPVGNFYKCFGCGKGGNSVNFVMEHEKMSFPEAIRYLADKYGISLEEDKMTDEEIAEVKAKDNLHALAEYAAQYFEDELKNTEEGQTIGLSYFKERGYLDSTIKTFRLGYSANNRIKFTQKAMKDGYDLQMLKDCGLTAQSGNDFFYNRVMFTIQDVSGRPVAFAGRILSKQVKAPKYINSPETEIYKKSHVLYGLYQARQSMRKEDFCIIVEGYTDVLSMHQAGIENVVASSGTSLTDGQVLKIKRFTNNVVMLYDGDAAGVKAAIRSIDIIHEKDMQVHLVLLPGDHDPDSFVSDQGASGFKTYIDQNAMDFIAFRQHLFAQSGQDDPVSKSQIIKELIESIAKIPDAIKRTLYVRQCADAFKIDEEIVMAELNKVIRKEIYNQRKKEERQQRQNEEEWIADPKSKPQAQTDDLTKDSDVYQEKDILRVLILYGDKYIDEEEETTLTEFVMANLEPVIHTFNEAAYKKLLNIAVEQYNKELPVHKELFINHEDPDIQKTALDIISTPYEYSPNWSAKGMELQTQVLPEKNFEKDAMQAILRFKLKKIVKQCKDIYEKILQEDQEGNTDTVEKLYKSFAKLTQDKTEVTEQLNAVILE